MAKSGARGPAGAREDRGYIRQQRGGAKRTQVEDMKVIRPGKVREHPWEKPSTGMDGGQVGGHEMASTQNGGLLLSFPEIK